MDAEARESVWVFMHSLQNRTKKILGVSPRQTLTSPFSTGFPELIQFGETSYCFILNNSADKTTFVEQLCIDNQRMFQIVHEGSLIFHMIPGIFELSCNYDIKFADYVTRCLLKKKQNRNQTYCQKFINNSSCVMYFSRDKWKKCQNQIKNT